MYQTLLITSRRSGFAARRILPLVGWRVAGRGRVGTCGVGVRVWRIGVIGGGPGGLLTGYFLQCEANDPFRVTLFEASDRPGGKVW